jgi:hypothetical protein
LNTSRLRHLFSRHELPAPQVQEPLPTIQDIFVTTMSEDNYNIIHTQLPSMPAYIATHIDRNVSSSAMVGQKCLICQEDFDPSLDEAFFTASQDDTTCVRVPPCNHQKTISSLHT